MTAPQAPAAGSPSPDPGIRRLLLRSSSVAWTASAVLLGIGALVAVAWLYITIRQQLQLGDELYSGPFDDSEGDVSFWERLDLGTSNLFYLAEAGVVAGAGFGLRILGDFAAVRAGGPATAAAPAVTEVTLDRDDWTAG